MADKPEDIRNDARPTREDETRSAEAVPYTFVPAGLIPEVKKEPGYEYRWVRVGGGAGGSNSDAVNMTAKMREGWVPVKASEQPQIIQFHDKKSRFNGLIEHGGLLLCKITSEYVEARRRYYADKARAQMVAVDNNFMRENDRRMPLFKESKSEVKRSG